jgi:hypothetical protein
VPTEDGLYYSIECVYPIKELDNPYEGKNGHTAS